MLAFAVMAVPAMASVQNVKVSGDIESTYISRDYFDLIGTDQNVFITQTRLRIDADLTDKVMATIAMINEREWGNTGQGAADTDIDLNLAYVTMKEMLYSPLTVTVGRQEFAFGNSFVIDSAGSNNSAPVDSSIAGIAGDLTKQTAQDAIRLTFDYDPLTIDVLYASIDQATVSGVKESDNTDLFGINAAYQFNDKNNSMVEGYFWVRDTNNAGNELYMPGVRGSMNITDAWNLQAEAAVQFGTISFSDGEYDRFAYAAQFLSNYILPFEKTKEYQPVFGTSYTMYSGDKTWNTSSSGDGDYNGWDPMYENQAGGKIINALFNASDIHVLGATLDFVPVQDVAANLYYDYLWLDKETTFALVQPTGGSANTTTATDDSVSLGQELGMVLTYDYTEDVQFGARAGWFFPGDVFDNSSAKTASQILLNAKVAF